MQNEEYAQKFTVLYDLVYSKEDCSIAENMLQKMAEAKDTLNDLDKAKFLLVMLEIQYQLGKPLNDDEIKSLLEINKDGGNGWEKVKNKYYEILHAE